MSLFESTCFEPTFEAAQARLAAVKPAAYARTRNALDGAVTRLSPYLTHGLLSLRDVYDAVKLRHPLDAKHKFVFELGWRAYWRHVWEDLGDEIHQSQHQGLLPEHTYQLAIPVDVLEARTGIPAIDQAVRELYGTGYLHNHARMWLASYLVHLRKVHWHVGAQWMLGYLLDGDLASNHLSWQWVAGTGSSKPYLFNADNVAKYAPAHWHSPSTSIDTSYEALDGIARRAAAIDARFDQRKAGEGIVQPLLRASPPGLWQSPGAARLDITARDVWLHHPWSLGAPTLQSALHDLIPLNALHIAVGFDVCHATNPWSEQRWDFVRRGLQINTQHLWWGSAAQIAAALQGANSVQWQTNPHADSALSKLRNQFHQSDPKVLVNSHTSPCLFEPVHTHCRSFSDWWKRTHIA